MFVSEATYKVYILNRQTIYQLEADKSNFLTNDQNIYNDYNKSYESSCILFISVLESILMSQDSDCHEDYKVCFPRQ